MKKGLLYITLMVLLMMPMTALMTVRAEQSGHAAPVKLRGVWFSYIDWDEMPEEEQAFRKRARQVMETIREDQFNAVFCHVHSHSDSYYDGSAWFPRSSILKGRSYDALGIMVEEAHRAGLQFHAWFNPYRVTGYLVPWEKVPADSVVRHWMTTAGSERNVLYYDGSGKGQYYLNPSQEEVIDHITGAVREVMQRYPVDGVQFDDYFYPSLEDRETAFDYADFRPDSGASKKGPAAAEGQISGSSQALVQWRRDNVSKLVRAVHAAVHEEDPDAVFGVSPVCSLDSLRSSYAYFVDIDRWMKSEDYIDYIMPQIYHGFEAKTGSGKEAPHAYLRNLESWLALHRETASPVRLMVGLGLYKCGTDTWDGNAEPEWLRYQDIMKRQVEAAEATGAVSGYGVYDFSDLEREEAEKEVQGLKEVFKRIGGSD